MSAERAGALAQEHLLLGADLRPSEDTGLLSVISYPREKDLDETLSSGAALADLTGSTYRLLTGAGAPALAAAALAGRRLSVGEAAFEAVVTGDGALAAVPLCLRCGDHELVLLDPTPRGAVAAGWIGFLSGIEQGGRAAFPEVELEEASGMLVPLLLAGAAAEAVLADYVRAEEPLPGPGRVTSLHLDAIPALVARADDLGTPCYVVLVPPASARVLWRSLLSFTEVEPVGSRAVTALFEGRAPWSCALSPEGPARVGRARLASWGLMREEDDFVGARALDP